MPITGPSSYVPTMNKFITHWGEVNAALGAGGPLITDEGAAIAVLMGYRNDLQTFRGAVQGRINDVEIAAGTVTGRRDPLLVRLGEFNRKVRGSLGKSPFVVALPGQPSSNAGEVVVLEALEDVKTLWPKINAATIAGFTPPLTLLGGYPVATFLTDLAALGDAYFDGDDAEQELKLVRERRNDVQDLAYAVMKDYRAAVLGSFAPEDALVASMPALTPAPGSTPAAVTAAISWVQIMGKAKITWTASTAADLDQYEIRFCPGPHYSTDIEVVIGNIASSAAREFFTDHGLAAVGDVASFRVYVITTTGNEKGSNTVTITRPAAA